MRTLYRNFETQAQIDAQYNPSLVLTPGDQPMEHFTAQAQRARATLRHTLDVPYGPTVEETLDIFPTAAPNAPVFVGSGYWHR